MSLPDRRFSVQFSSENSDQRMDLSFEDSQDLSVNFGEIQTVTTQTDYELLTNKPQINGVELVGNKTTEDLGIDVWPSGGSTGDILTRRGEGAVWETPANHAEEDNTRPITAAAVYTEIGNINALLAGI